MNKAIPASEYCVKVFDGTHDTPKPVLNGFPLVTSKNILGGILNLKNTYNISSEDYLDIQKRSKVSQWDILFSMIGSVGETYIEKTPNIPYAIKNVGVFSCHDEYKAKWLYYYFKSPQAKQHIQNYLNGAVQKFLPLGALRSFPVLPYYESYIPIVDLLSAIDSKIELNNRINTELEAMAKTLYDYWFVQFDVPFDFSQGKPDKNGKPYKSSGGKMVWSEELKREIPVGWNPGTLTDIAKITMGQSPPGESYNEAGDGIIFYQGCTDFGNRFPSIRQYTTAPTRHAKAGDILLSVRAPVGTLNIAKEDCCIGRGLAALSSISNCQAYLFEVLRNMKQIFDRRNVDGTTFGAITKDDLFSLPVAIPSESILKKYQEITTPIFERQNIIEWENIKLGELRDWLLPMLMNGQVKVNEVEHA